MTEILGDSYVVIEYGVRSYRLLIGEDQTAKYEDCGDKWAKQHCYALQAGGTGTLVAGCLAGAYGLLALLRHLFCSSRSGPVNGVFYKLDVLSWVSGVAAGLLWYFVAHALWVINASDVTGVSIQLDFSFILAAVSGGLQLLLCLHSRSTWKWTATASVPVTIGIQPIDEFGNPVGTPFAAAPATTQLQSQPSQRWAREQEMTAARYPSMASTHTASYGIGPASPSH